MVGKLGRLALAVSLAVAVPVAMLSLAPAAGAEGKEQIVFSGTGSGSFGDFGFWVWCAVEGPPHYEDECNGAMYFYDLGLVKHVTGEASEPAEDVYQMDVESRDGSVECTLMNEPPILHGPRNTVDVSCSSPAGMGSSMNAVVVATG